MAINFSRSGSQIIGQYYVFFRFGRKGITRIQCHTRDVCLHLAEAIKGLGIFEIFNEGTNLPVLCYRLKDAEKRKWTLYELADRLAMKGWQVPAYTLPDDMRDVVIQRLVVRADLSYAMAEALIKDLAAAVDYLETNTVTDAPGKKKTGAQGFTH